MRRLAGLAPFLLMLLGTCGGDPATGIDRQTFEDVMVELRMAGQDSDSLAFMERRREILEAAGVTDSLLHGFVRAHAADIEYMLAIWESIDLRVNGMPEDVDPDTLSAR